MIKIDGVEIAMEGSFGTLIREAARAIHTVAKAASEKFKNDGEEEVDYNTVVEHVLEELATLKKFDVNGGSVEMPDGVEDDFFIQLQNEREKNSDKESFIDYDTQRPDPDAATKIIKSVIKDVYIDPRSETLDIEDLKAIKKAEKKKKNKKK